MAEFDRSNGNQKLNIHFGTTSETTTLRALDCKLLIVLQAFSFSVKRAIICFDGAPLADKTLR